MKAHCLSFFLFLLTFCNVHYEGREAMRGKVTKKKMCTQYTHTHNGHRKDDFPAQTLGTKPVFFFLQIITTSLQSQRPTYNTQELCRIFAPTLTAQARHPTLTAQARSQERHGVSRSQAHPVCVCARFPSFTLDQTSSSIQCMVYN